MVENRMKDTRAAELCYSSYFIRRFERTVALCRVYVAICVAVKVDAEYNNQHSFYPSPAQSAF